MMTVSSGWIMTQALISPGMPEASLFHARSLQVAASCDFKKRMPSAKPPAAVSAVVTNVRRETVMAIIVIVVSSRSRAHQSGRTMRRAAKPLIGAATADVGETRVDIGVGRVWRGLEEGDRRHD